ncbi:ABC transporter permease, partial [Rhizobium ruizarguesonis]
FSDIPFRETFGYSMLMAFFTIVFVMLLVVPMAYWVRLRLPQMRPVVEFITLLPLVIPAIVIFFGYLRMYNSSSYLPLTGSTTSRMLVPVV